MIAIPVKTDKSESAIAPLFGKAKWFAIVDAEGTIEFWHNELKSGRAVVEEFEQRGVTKVIFQDMGANPFMQLARTGIECYHSGRGRVLLREALEYHKSGALIRVTPENMFEYVEHSHRHARGEEHEGHHHGEARGGRGAL